MKKHSLLDFFEDLFYAACMAVFFTPTLYLSDIIAMKTDSLVILLPYLVVSAWIYGLAVLGKPLRHIWIRWGLSVPLSLGCMVYFWETNFAIRALNWVYPEYGKPSAGSELFLLVVLMVIGFLCISEIVVLMFFCETLHPKIKKWQFPVCLTAMIIIILIVVLLERQFPSMRSIEL